MPTTTSTGTPREPGGWVSLTGSMSRHSGPSDLKQIGELVTRVCELAALETAGGVTPGATVGCRLRVRGAWSIGQVLQHLARVGEALAAAAPASANGTHAPTSKRGLHAWTAWGERGHTNTTVDLSADARFAPDAHVWTDVAGQALAAVLTRLESGGGVSNPGAVGAATPEKALGVFVQHAGDLLGRIDVRA